MPIFVSLYDYSCNNNKILHIGVYVKVNVRFFKRIVVLFQIWTVTSIKVILLNVIAW